MRDDRDALEQLLRRLHTMSGEVQRLRDLIADESMRRAHVQAHWQDTGKRSSGPGGPSLQCPDCGRSTRTPEAKAVHDALACDRCGDLADNRHASASSSDDAKTARVPALLPVFSEERFPPERSTPPS